MTALNVMQEADRAGIRLSDTAQREPILAFLRGNQETDAEKPAASTRVPETVSVPEGPGNCHPNRPERSSPCFPRPVSPQEVERWDEEHGWLKKLAPSDLPSTLFLLHPSVEVVAPAKFLRRLQQDIARGPRSPRARTGALQGDCRRLKEVLGECRKEAGHGTQGHEA